MRSGNRVGLVAFTTAGASVVLFETRAREFMAHLLSSSARAASAFWTLASRFFVRASTTRALSVVPVRWPSSFSFFAVEADRRTVMGFFGSSFAALPTLGDSGVEVTWVAVAMGVSGDAGGTNFGAGVAAVVVLVEEEVEGFAGVALGLSMRGVHRPTASINRCQPES